MAQRVLPPDGEDDEEMGVPPQPEHRPRPALATEAEIATQRSAMILQVDQRHVKLSGDVEGAFVIEEVLADGRLVVAPEWPSPDTSADAILERAGAKRMSPEEFDEHFGHLPSDGEG